MGLESSSSILTWFANRKQADYLTANPSSATFRRLGEIDKFVFDVTPTIVEDTENNGGDEPTGSFVTTNLFNETPFNTHASFQDLPYWVQMIMGNIASAGSGAVKTHTGSALNKGVSRQHPVRTFGQREGSNIYIYPSVGLRELRIARNEIGRLRITATPHGRGIVLKNPASYAVPSQVNDRTYGYNNQAVHNVAETTLTIEEYFSCAIRSWEWVFTNNATGDGFNDCSADYQTGKPDRGQVRAEWETSAYDWKFNCQVRRDSATKMRDLLGSGKRASLNTLITSTEFIDGTTPFSTLITDPNADLTSVSKEIEQGGYILQNLGFTIRPSKITGLMETQIIVANNVASYTS